MKNIFVLNCYIKMNSQTGFDHVNNKGGHVMMYASSNKFLQDCERMQDWKEYCCFRQISCSLCCCLYKNVPFVFHSSFCLLKQLFIQLILV